MQPCGRPSFGSTGTVCFPYTTLFRSLRGRWRRRFGRLLAGRLGGGLNGADQDVSIAAFHARLAFHGTVRGQIARETDQQLFAEIGVRDFAAAELNHRFDAVALAQKANRVVHLEVVVVIVGVGTELEFLHLDHVLLLLGVVLLLLLLVLIVAVVDGLGDGWNRRGSDQYEIEPQLLGLPQGGGGGHDFRGAVGEHRAHFPCTDGFIYVLSAILPARGEISAWIHVMRLVADWGSDKTRAGRP